MHSANASGNLSSEMEVDAFRRLFPLHFQEHHLLESIRPDARKLGKAIDTTLALGVVASTDGSALAKIGCTDIYCLDADGALFDAALLAAVAAFSHLQIPVVSLNDDGRVVVVSEEDGGKLKNEPVNKGKRKVKLSSIPSSLTCILHKNYILADPTAEEESIMETLVTVVLDSSFQLVFLHKPSGPVLAYTSAIQACIALTRQRVKELQKVLNEAISAISKMEGD